jgi:hypothetical protein
MGQKLKLFLKIASTCVDGQCIANAKAETELLFAWIRSLPVFALWDIQLVCISIISTCFPSKFHLSNDA